MNILNVIQEAAMNIKIQRANAPDSPASQIAAERNRELFPILEQHGVSHGTVIHAAAMSERELAVMLNEYK